MRIVSAGKIRTLCLVVLAAACAGAWAQQGWVAQASGTLASLNAVRFLNADTGWVVGDAGVIMRSTNGGASWVGQTSGTTNSLYGMHFASTSVGWVAGNSGTILKTTDAGVSWNAQSSGVARNLRALSFLSSGTGWAVGDSGVVLKTTNGGSSWTAVSPPATTVNLKAVHFSSELVGWVAGSISLSSGRLFQTIGGGETWSQVYSGAAISALCFVGNYGYWAGTSWRTITMSGFPMPVTHYYWQPRIQRTSNATAWSQVQFSGETEVSGYQEIGPRGIHFVDAQNGWLVGSSGLIARSTDNGATWGTQSANSSALNAVHFVSANNGWAVGVGGVILKTTDGGGPVGIAPRSHAPSESIRMQGGRLLFNLSDPVRVTATLRGLDGASVATLADGPFAAGPHSLDLSAVGLPAGVYLLDFRAGTLRESRRVVLP